MTEKGFETLNDRGLAQLCESFGMKLSANGDMVTGTTRQLRAAMEWAATIERATWIKKDLLKEWEAKYNPGATPHNEN